MKKAMSAILLVMMVLGSLTNVLALETKKQESLQEVYEKAREEFEKKSIIERTKTIDSYSYYDEIELDDGEIIIVRGYPTDYRCDLSPLKEGEQSDNIIYSIANAYIDETGEKKSLVWGYFSSTLKYYEDTKNNKVRIDSFSYKASLNAGYSLSKMIVTYASYFANESESYSFETTSLTMTNYPTTRLGWVLNEYSEPMTSSNTFVNYVATVNGKTYDILHSLVPKTFTIK